jgi:transcriptional regulator with PAS, ATPase and Fis domain
MKHSVLISWIGHTDLRAMAEVSSPELQNAISKICGPGSRPDGPGPIKATLINRSFDKVYLLSNYPEQIGRRFSKWINANTEVLPTELDNPTDYKAVYKVTEAALKLVTSRNENTNLFILLSPGTPAMAAVFVLLGKTKYPAHFLQSYKDKVFDADIPFDITVDVIPELLHSADSSLDQLSRLSPRDIPGFESIIGESKSIRLAVGRAQRAALRDVTVLLTGESGTGKELFARAIHAASRRKEKPFITVNCAALPRDLLESELFGHVKGSFTGAISDHEGAFVRADGGVLFLDEIGECSPEIQAKLLRAIQPLQGQHTSIREIQPIGSRKAVAVDVRIISATNRDLFGLVEKGAFRSDLYYRMAVITINLPALREKKSDIEMIAQKLLAQINEDFAKNEPGYNNKYLCGSAKKFVKTYDWPGNVRELYNVLIQAAVMTHPEGMAGEDLEQCIGGARRPRAGMDPMYSALGDGFSLDAAVDELQKHYIKRALEEAHGVKAKAARLLGIENYQTLDARMKKLQIS